ncbi:MAG TPA: hypothetical protein PLE81_08480 [Brevundimonas sp.]|jgi:hypothetical protein|uniref:hypothetical protein n=1 Tax=Brevundimonas sp. TaxID=1871086 RepID=UPI002CA22551|nr:hypothetical protein [Brevundimonas sp.]HRH20658.1 hypothetical protein [Brevundimonas sp.]
MRALVLALPIICTAGLAQAQTYAPPGPGEPTRFAMGAGIGTTGLYIEGQFRVTSYISLRATYEKLDVEREQGVDDITYGGQLDSGVLGGFVQIHPAESSFFVSGGALFGERSVALSAQPSAPVSIGNQTFTPTQIGRLQGEADLGDRAVAVSTGWDSTFGRVRGLGWRVAAGVAVGPSPEIHMNSVGGTLSSDPILQSQLRIEEGRIEDEAQDYRIYPVVQVGLTWRF